MKKRLNKKGFTLIELMIIIMIIFILGAFVLRGCGGCVGKYDVNEPQIITQQQENQQDEELRPEVEVPNEVKDSPKNSL